MAPACSLNCMRERGKKITWIQEFRGQEDSNSLQNHHQLENSDWEMPLRNSELKLVMNNKMKTFTEDKLRVSESVHDTIRIGQMWYYLFY